MSALRRDPATGQSVLVLPAQHPATLTRRGKNPNDALRSKAQRVIQQVYAPGFVEVLDFPAEAVLHIPAASLNVTRLVQCANYDHSKGTSSCKMGRKCKFVHADLAQLTKRHEVHINYAWRSEQEVSYARYPAGQVLRVAQPASAVSTMANGEPVIDVMESQLALKTQAIGTGPNAARRPLSHCAHYYYNRACNLGSDCQFVHAVFIDPEAKPHQRAPMPVYLGRGGHCSHNNNGQQSSNNNNGCAGNGLIKGGNARAGGNGGNASDHADSIPAPRGAAAVKAAAAAKVSTAVSAQSFVAEDVEASFAAPTEDLHSGSHTPIHDALASSGNVPRHESGHSSRSQTPPLSTGSSGSAAGRRYRHDPYATTFAVTPLVYA